MVDLICRNVSAVFGPEHTCFVEGTIAEGHNLPMLSYVSLFECEDGVCVRVCGKSVLGCLAQSDAVLSMPSAEFSSKSQDSSYIKLTRLKRLLHML